MKKNLTIIMYIQYMLPVFNWYNVIRKNYWRYVMYWNHLPRQIFSQSESRGYSLLKASFHDYHFVSSQLLQSELAMMKCRILKFFYRWHVMTLQQPWIRSLMGFIEVLQCSWIMNHDILNVQIVALIQLFCIQYIFHSS